MNITTIGIDLAKNVFQIHGVDGHGKAVLRKQLRRGQMRGFFANLPACLVGMEACGGAHYWAGKLQGLGHTVRLMSPQFVKPYVKTNKNDAADAEAICEAVARPNMRFVPIKNVEQQTVLSLHRARQAIVKMRTAQANQIRGLLAEFGVVMPAREVGARQEDAGRSWPAADRRWQPHPRAYQPTARAVSRTRRAGKGTRRADQAWHREDKEPTAAGHPRNRAAHRERSGGQRRRCEYVQERSAICGLAGSRTSAMLLRRQRTPARHQQARRHVLADNAGSRSSGDAAPPATARRSGGGLAGALGRAAQREHRGGGAGE